MEIVEKRKFSRLLSELIVLADEVAKNFEVEVHILVEFAMLVEKFSPIFNDLRDKTQSWTSHL